jgi:hypothetical protein
MPQEIYGNATPDAQAAARASGGVAPGVSPADAAKWAAYRQALAAYNQRKQIESHGGPPVTDPPPAAPTAAETPSAYPSSPQFTEPTTAGGGNNPMGGTILGNEPRSAWNTPGRPQGLFYVPPAAPGTAGAPTPATTAPSSTLNPTQLDTGESEQIRGQQLDYLNALRDRMAGKAPSVGATQFRIAQNDVARQSLGLAAQARGTDAAVARRQAMQTIGDQTQRAGLSAALVQAQEQATAADQLGAALGMTRGQDIGTAGANAGLAADANKTSFLEGGVNNRFNTGLTTGVSESAADRASREYIAKYQAEMEQKNRLLGGGIGAATTFGGKLLSYYLGLGDDSKKDT